MNTRFRIAAILLGVIVLSGLAWRAVHSRQATYQSVPLIVWLHQFNEADDLAARRTARDAVEHIGTNGIPILLGMIALKEPPAKKREVPWIQRQQMVKLSFLSPDEERYLAVSGFELLGTQANSAVLRLLQLAASTNLNVRNLALRSLTFAEPDLEKLRPALLQLVQNPDPGVSASATRFLKTFEPLPITTQATNQNEAAPSR